jgi:hypothetical protein
MSPLAFRNSQAPPPLTTWEKQRPPPSSPSITLFSSPANHITMSDIDPDALADELSGIITALETTPDNVGLIKREIEIMRQLEMMPEALDTILRLSTLVMIEEGESYMMHG